MKLKIRDCTNGERRPGVADSQLLPNTKIVRTTLLAITAVGLAALVRASGQRHSAHFTPSRGACRHTGQGRPRNFA